jgi:hypothetical protein
MSEETLLKKIERQKDELAIRGFEPKNLILNRKCYEQIALLACDRSINLIDRYHGLNIVVVPWCENDEAIVTCDPKTELCHSKKLAEIREKGAE